MTVDLPVALTFDIEKDCCPLLNSAVGVEVGVPRILELLDKFRITGTFFVTGEVAEAYSSTVKEIARKHEISSHGYHHERCDRMTPRKRTMIAKSRELLQKVSGQRVVGFRAPRFLVSQELYETLVKIGFSYDSSIACFRPQHLGIETYLPEFRVQLPSAMLNLPGGLRIFRSMCNLRDFPVMTFHCWEAVETRPLLASASSAFATFARPDLWLKTGFPFLKRLTELLGSLCKAGFNFTTLGKAVGY